MTRTVRKRLAAAGPTADGAPPPDDGESAITRRVPALLHRLVAALVEATAPTFRDYGMSIPAARTLVSLLETQGMCTVGSLSQATCIEVSTVSHILRRLEAVSYVQRERQANDNRVVQVLLTEQGREVAEACLKASLAHEAALLTGMSRDEIALLRSSLERVYRNTLRHLTHPGTTP